VAVRAFHTLSLCSGVGGLDLGVSLAIPAARVVCYVERNPFCRRILRCRMRDGCLDDAPIWDDLRTFDGRPWRGLVDCVVAGYPCQGFSSAARGRHTRPDLSGEVLRVVSGCRPAFVFVENVYHARGSLAALRGSLWGLGYRGPPLLDCRASDVGAPHQRSRLFLLAHADGHGEPGLPFDGEVAGLPAAGANVWEDHAAALGVDDGLAGRAHRLSAAGNGVCPLAAAHALRTLAASAVTGAGR